MDRKTELKLLGDGSISVAWIVSDNWGAVVFMGSITPNYLNKHSIITPGLFMPFGIDHHSRLPDFGGVHNKKCIWLNGDEGFCDGTSLGAMGLFQDIVNQRIKTDEDLWLFLEQRHKEVFHAEC